MEKYLEANTYEEGLRGTYSVQLRKRRMRGDLITVFNFRKGGSRGADTDLLFLVTIQRTPGKWNGTASGKVQVGHQEKVQWEGGQSLEQTPQENGCCIKPVRVQGVSGQCFQ